MGTTLRSTTDKALPPAERPAWRASCEACGWSHPAPTYAAAGEAAREHGGSCPDAATVVEAARS